LRCGRNGKTERDFSERNRTGAVDSKFAMGMPTVLGHANRTIDVSSLPSSLAQILVAKSDSAVPMNRGLELRSAQSN